MKRRCLIVFALMIVLRNLLVAADLRPDLVGRVTKGDGSALAKATVFIYSAGPKQGTASVCPYCYTDCRKKAETASDGRFKIESLDPQLLFRLLIVAGGYEPKFVTKVDPAAGEQQVSMQLISQADCRHRRR
jgi:hypothetical protein